MSTDMGVFLTSALGAHTDYHFRLLTIGKLCLYFARRFEKTKFLCFLGHFFVSLTNGLISRLRIFVQFVPVRHKK